VSEIDVVLIQKIQISCYFLPGKSERKKCVEKENYQLWKGIRDDSQKWEAKITAAIYLSSDKARIESSTDTFCKKHLC